MTMRIGIIGGGPGGLMTAYLLERPSPRPVSLTLFEASGRLGGKILTRSFGKVPIPYEAGAAELYDYSQLGPDPLRELIASFGLPVHELVGETVVLGDCILKTEADIGRELGPDALRADSTLHSQGTIGHQPRRVLRVGLEAG